MLRGFSSAVGISATGGVCSKPAGVVAGDRLYALVNSDGFNAASSTGWNSPNDATINIFFDNQSLQVLSKTAGGSEPADYTFTNVSLGSIVIVALYGRAAGNTVGTDASSDAGNTDPITATANGITLVAGDDVLWVGGLDQNTDEAWASSAPAGFTTLVQAAPAGEYSAMCVGVLLNASAGATGTKSGTFTGGSGQAGWGAVMIATPSDGSGPGATFKAAWARNSNQLIE